MSNLLSDTPFLPASAPADPIFDCAGVLSSASLNRLNTQAAQASFKPRVVILPADFAPRSMAALSSNIAQQWHISGNTLLIVINLHGRNLRIIPGAALKSKGLTDRTIANLVAVKFGPPMRKLHSAGSLSSALPESISNTIDGVNEILGHGKTAGSIAASEHTLPGVVQPLTGPTTWLVPVVVAVIAVFFLSFLYLNQRRS